MRMISIRNWNGLYENSRSRAVKELDWVAVPNRHDGENFSLIMAHTRGSEIFSAFILMVQVASKCTPRGTLVKDNGTPHNASSLSVKCRAPITWFEIAIEYLESKTDWLDIEDVADGYQRAISVPSACHRVSAEEGKGREGKEGKGISAVDEVVEGWNCLEGFQRVVNLSEGRRSHLSARLKSEFWKDNWRSALMMIPRSESVV